MNAFCKNMPDKQPSKNTVFIAKLKNSEKFIMVEMLSDTGWLTTPYLKVKYWVELKLLIDFWIDVKNIA